MIAKVTLTDAPTPEMRKAIVEPLIEFNHSRIGKPETYRPLAILLSDPESDEIVGGPYGSTAFSTLWVYLLFVPESMRGTGIGRKLMSQSEAEAILRGCHAATLDTFSFQARGFSGKTIARSCGRVGTVQAEIRAIGHACDGETRLVAEFDSVGVVRSRGRTRCLSSRWTRGGRTFRIRGWIA